MKTLIYDIEICHSYDDVYKRRMYGGYIDTGIRMSADISILTHFGYKWLGEKKAHCKDLTDFKSFKKDKFDQSELVKFASDLFQKADHLVAHYGDKFDRRYMNAKLMQYKLPVIPPPPIINQTDTCKLARQHLKLSANRLDNIARFFGTPMKRSKNWPDDWLKMTAGDRAAYKRVKHYCIGDIITLEDVFNKLRCFSKNIPNQSYMQNEHACIGCGSKNYIKYGNFFVSSGAKQRYVCKDCGKQFHEGQLSKHVA